MAVPFFNDIEQKFFIQQTGSYGPRDDLKRRFYKSQGAIGFSINALETNWLEIKIRSLGGTPSSHYDTDLWRQLVALSGLRVSKNISENKLTYYLNASIFSATGGDITSVGGNTIHTFTSSGTFSVTGSGNVHVLVVAGGGGGASGGGGGGGVIDNTSYACTTGDYTVTIGNGGAYGSGYSGPTAPTNGQNSVFNDLTAVGGGKGGLNISDTVTNGGNGGSGGGGAYSGVGTTTAGTGTVGQGNNGGTNGGQGNPFPSGGGGGAGGVGQSAPDTTHGGNGGSGYTSDISGSSVEYAGGGGGSVYGGGTGGSATGGGTAGNATGGSADNCPANLGGGGGGAPNGVGLHGGNGGSGVVIISYPA